MYRGEAKKTMDVDYLLLADAATLADGKLYIHGAGWETISVTSLPVEQSLHIVLRIRVPWSETKRQSDLELDVVDTEGKSLLAIPPGPTRGTINVGRPSHVKPGDDHVVPLALHLSNVPFQREGTYAVVFRIDGSEVARTPFKVAALRDIAP